MENRLITTHKLQNPEGFREDVDSFFGGEVFDTKMLFPKGNEAIFGHQRQSDLLKGAIPLYQWNVEDIIQKNMGDIIQRYLAKIVGAHLGERATGQVRVFGTESFVDKVYTPAHVFEDIGREKRVDIYVRLFGQGVSTLAQLRASTNIQVVRLMDETLTSQEPHIDERGNVDVFSVAAWETDSLRRLGIVDSHEVIQGLSEDKLRIFAESQYNTRRKGTWGERPIAERVTENIVVVNRDVDTVITEEEDESMTDGYDARIAALRACKESANLLQKMGGYQYALKGGSYALVSNRTVLHAAEVAHGASEDELHDPPTHTFDRQLFHVDDNNPPIEVPEVSRKPGVLGKEMRAECNEAIRALQ